MENTEITETTTEEKGGKLKSRKFWITIAVAAYFALMALKEQGVEDTATKIIYAVCIAVVVIGYLIIEGTCDAEDIAAGDLEEIESGEDLG